MSQFSQYFSRSSTSQMVKVVLLYAVVAGLGAFVFEYTADYLVTNPENANLILTILVAICLAIGIIVSARSKWLNHRFEAQTLKPEQILSNREIQVFNELRTTKTNREISEELFIEMSTLKTHINRIYKKLELNRRIDLREKYGLQAVVK